MVANMKLIIGATRYVNTRAKVGDNVRDYKQ